MSYSRIYTRASSNYNQSGSWTVAPNSNYGTQAYSSTGSAYWEVTEDLIPGTTYKIYTTWDSLGDASTSTHFEVIDLGDGLPAAVKNLDQTVAPSDITHEGYGWALIGEYMAGSYGCIVTLIDSPGGKRWIDSILITEGDIDPPSDNVTGSLSGNLPHSTLSGSGTLGKLGQINANLPAKQLGVTATQTPPGASGTTSLTKSSPTLTSSGGYSDYRTTGFLASNRPFAIWPCNSLTTSTSPDTSGFGRTITFTGNPTLTTADNKTYLSFSIFSPTVGTFTPFQTEDDFTFRVKLRPLSAYQSYRRDLLITPTFKIYISSSDKIAVQLGTTTVLSTSVMDSSNWNDVVVSFKSDGQLIIAVNGNVEYSGMGWSTGRPTISQVFTSTNYFIGHVDDIRFYDNFVDLTTLDYPDSRLIPRTMSGSGTATPPVFTGDLTLDKSHQLLTSENDLNDGIFRGTAHLSTPKRSTNGIVQYSYKVNSLGQANLPAKFLQTQTSIFLPAIAPLVVIGADEFGTANKLPLYVRGKDTVNNSIPLVIKSASQPISSSIPLIVTSRSSGAVTLNLAVKGRSWQPVDSSVPMVIFGGSNSIFKAIPLIALGGTPRAQGVVFLSVSGSLSEAFSGSVDLFVQGGYSKASGTIPLAVAGRPSVSRSLPLFVKGPPGVPGSIPIEGILDLYVEMGLQDQGVIPLIVGGRSADATIPLHVRGRTSEEAVLPLYVLCFGGVVSQSVPLVVSGHVPTQISSTIPLVIGEVHDEIIRTLPLYLNAWRPR